jgi:hypothetical protein
VLKRLLLAAGTLLIASAIACSSAGSPLGPTSTSAAVVATASRTPPTTPLPVPEEYEGLYHDMEDVLAVAEARLAGGWDAAPASTVFGAELLVASGNRGALLLLPQTMAAVRLYLDRPDPPCQSWLLVLRASSPYTPRELSCLSDTLPALPSCRGEYPGGARLASGRVNYILGD